MLGVALLSVYLGARTLLLRVDEQRRSIAYAVTLAVLATLPAMFATLTRGLVVTSLLFALPALLRLRAKLYAPIHSERSSPIAVIGFVVLTSWVALTTSLWDEGSTHFGVSSAIARGVLPPEHPLFPGAPFAYHVGYDVLAGLVRASLAVPPDVACDIVTITCLVVLALLLSELGGWLAVVVVPLGYGPFAACLAEAWGAPFGAACGAHFPKSWVGAPQLPPPVVSNFFQHPQGLGLPILLAALLLFSTKPTTARLAIAAVLLALMSQIQVVLFFVLGLALGVMVLAARGGARVVLSRLIILALAGLLGLRLGGLASGLGDKLLFGQGYFREGALSLIAHHLALFGASLLAIPAALYVVWRSRGQAPRNRDALRIALVVSAATCFVIANVASYARSWDVVKFFAVGSFLGNILLADLLRTYWSRAKALCAAVLIVSTWSSAFWLLRHGPLNGVVAFSYTEDPPDAFALAFDAKASHLIAPRDRILTRHTQLSQLGYLVVGADWRRGGAGYLLDRERVDRERDLARRALATFDRAALDELRVDVIVDRRDVPGAELLAEIPFRGERWRAYRVRR